MDYEWYLYTTLFTMVSSLEGKPITSVCWLCRLFGEVQNLKHLVSFTNYKSVKDSQRESDSHKQK